MICCVNWNDNMSQSENYTIYHSFVWNFVNLLILIVSISLQWRHNERDDISNHRRPGCLLTPLFRRRWKETSKLRVTGLCEGNPSVTGGFSSQGDSNAENVSIWWRHDIGCCSSRLPSWAISLASWVSRDVDTIRRCRRWLLGTISHMIHELLAEILILPN